MTQMERRGDYWRTQSQFFVEFSLVRESSKLPKYATEGSSGMDIYADISAPLTVHPGQTVVVPGGFRIGLPQGFEAQVRPRSGLAAKQQVAAILGSIDCDYRGEVGVILHNFGNQPKTVEPGERVAQLVIAPVCHVEPVVVASLDITARGEGGFGHSGSK